MVKISIKPRLFFNKVKHKPEHQKENNESQLPPNLQSYKKNYYQEMVF